MRHRKYTFKIGRSSAHRKAMLGNLVCSLLSHGRIKTTYTKAKQVRRLADRMITLAKKGGLANRRRAAAALRSKEVVQLLFDEMPEKMADRNGGYTRMLKLGQRQGDAAEMSLVELVTEPVEPKPKKAKKAEEKAPEVKEEAPKEEPVAEEDTAEEENEEEVVAAAEGEEKSEDK